MEQNNHTAPFEGPEKLLEIWFATSISSICDALCTNCRCGLRKVRRQSWEAMLDIVKCKVLSVVEGDQMDAYLLRSADHIVPSSSRSHR
jgi:S-adenosylmethionine decarboxylase